MKILFLVSACEIPWWMALVAMGVPAILSWFMSSYNSKDAIVSKDKKILQLQEELKKCYQEKQIISTKLVKPKVRFSDMPSSKIKGKAPGQSDSDKPKSSSSVIRASKYPKLKNNLQVVEGVGPKMKEILNENGIQTLAQLASTSKEELESILHNYGSRYRIIDPSDWPKQANFAHRNQWKELISHQENSKKASAKGAKTVAKVTKMMRRYGYS